MTTPSDKGHYTTQLVPGHGLVREGAAHDHRGQLKRLIHDGAVLGYGKCQCGWLSSLLDSDRQRKQWHREHKYRVLTGELDETLEIMRKARTPGIRGVRT